MIAIGIIHQLLLLVLIHAFQFFITLLREYNMQFVSAKPGKSNQHKRAEIYVMLKGSRDTI